MLMLRRTPFRKPVYTPPPRAPLGGIVRRSVSGPAVMREPIEKENAIQHQGYMAAVRRIACRRCGTLAIPRQFCHADEGKGTAIKTDCRRGWAGCDACHYFVGSTGKLGKAGRRAFEETAAASTRAEVTLRGEWPARLPRWPE